MLKWLWLSAGVVACDQGSKWLLSGALHPEVPQPVLPFLSLLLRHNTGAAFSFLSDAGGWQRWFFVVLALGVSAVVVLWLRQLTRAQRILAVSLALVLGGALGNVIDRIRLGYVVDFIDVFYDKWHWPTFNIADSAITIGITLMLIDAFFIKRTD